MTTPARFQCFEDVDILRILTLDKAIISNSTEELKSRFFPKADTFQLDENGELWPNDEDKAVVTLPPSSWEMIRGRGEEDATDAGSWWQWDEPFLYTPKEQCREQPRTIIARCLGMMKYRDTTHTGMDGGAMIFLPVAIKNDRVFRKDIAGKILLRPIWFFEQHGCCLGVRRIEKETDIEKSIRLAGE